MPQTILALLALMVTVLFSVQQQRQVVDSRLDLIQDVLAIQLNGVATERLELVASKAFDEETTDPDARHTAASTLTAPTGFGANQDAPENDVDDFDGYENMIARPMRDESGTVIDSLRVQVTTEVEYVQKSSGSYAAWSSPTKFKRIRVKAETVNSMLPERAELTRIVSCGDACTW